MTEISNTTGTTPTTETAPQNEFRFGRVLGRTFTVFSRNILPFSLVAAIASLPTLLFALGSGQMATTGAGLNKVQAAHPGIAAALGGAFILWTFLWILSQATLLYAAFEDMRGRPVDLLQSARIGLRRIFPLIGVSFLIVLFISIATLALIFPAFIVVTMLFVAVPACVVERLGPMKSIKRSAHLTKGHRWKLFGLLLVTWIVTLIVQTALVRAVAMLGAPALAVPTAFVVRAVTSAFFVILPVVAYHDLRVAKEGIDTDRIAAVFD